MTNASRILRYAGLALLLAVLAVGPFFQGLFFQTPLLAGLLAVFVGFLLWLAGRRLGGLSSGLPGGAAGWALLALLGCYLIQFAWAVYPRGNIDWTLRAAAAWMVYAMVRAEAGPALRRWLGGVFVLSATAVAFVGFLEYTGYLTANPELAEALSVVGLHTRMFTVFQYPNTAAVYLMAALFAALGLALEDIRPWRAALAGAVAAFLGLAFFFTISRGAVVVLPFGLVLLLAGLSRNRRWPAVLLLLAAFFPLVVTMKPIGAAVAVRDYAQAFRWIGLGTGLGLAGGLLAGLLLRFRPRLQLALAVAAVVGGASILMAVRPADGFLPAQAARLLDINLRTDSVISRLAFDRHALEIVRDYPLGRGGKGWERTYRQYQEIAYTANETHNHYLQTAVEAGAPGLVCLIAAVLAGLWAAWRSRDEGPLGWTLAAGAGLIAGHSLIDFDLSYGLIWLLLWALFAVAASPATPLRIERPAAWTGAGAGLIAAGLAGLLLMGSVHIDRAEALAEEGRTEEAQAAARAALRYDRWDSRPLLILEDRASLERAAELDPNNYHVHFRLALALEREREFDDALHAARKALESYPLSSLYWGKVASLEGRLMVEALHDGNLEAAGTRAESLAALGRTFEGRQAESQMSISFMGAPDLQMTNEFKLRYGQALYLAGDLEKAERLLSEASQAGLLGAEGEVWLYALYERRGDREALQTLSGKPWVRFRNLNPVYRLLVEW